MTLPIITHPNPILRLKGKVLTKANLSGKKIPEFIDNLVETMYASDGVGIAAPQVGKSVQICVIAKNFTDKKESDLVLVNPEWQKMTLKRLWGDEGCLSVPFAFGKVRRYQKIRVTALDESGKPIRFEAKDFFARVIQHEIDHLNGILFIDKARDIHRTDHKL